MKTSRLKFSVDSQRCFFTLLSDQEENSNEAYDEVYNLLTKQLNLPIWTSVGHGKNGYIFYVPTEICLENQVYKKINKFIQQHDLDGNEELDAKD